MTTSPDEPAGAATGLLLERAGAATSPDQAAALYRELLAASPGHVEARLHLARLLEQGEQLEDAVKTLSVGLRWMPDQVELLLLRGALLGRLGRYQRRGIRPARRPAIAGLARPGPLRAGPALLAEGTRVGGGDALRQVARAPAGERTGLLLPRRGPQPDGRPRGGATQRWIAHSRPHRGTARYTTCAGGCSTGSDGRTRRARCISGAESCKTRDHGSGGRSRLAPGGCRAAAGRGVARAAGGRSLAARSAGGAAIRRPAPGELAARGGSGGGHRRRRSGGTIRDPCRHSGFGVAGGADHGTARARLRLAARAEWGLGRIGAPLVGADAGPLSLEESATLLVETFPRPGAADNPAELCIVVERQEDRDAVEAIVRRTA